MLPFIRGKYDEWSVIAAAGKNIFVRNQFYNMEWNDADLTIDENS